MKKRKKSSAALDEKRLAAAESGIALGAWLHAELLHYLAHVINIHSNAIQTTAWLFAEKNFALEQFIASEERLVRRARAVKEAQQRAAAGPQAINPNINPAAMQRLP